MSSTVINTDRNRARITLYFLEKKIKKEKKRWMVAYTLSKALYLHKILSTRRANSIILETSPG